MNTDLKYIKKHMYNRYRKRDRSEIDRKSEIGLGRVDDYSSSDISEAVIQNVRDYLYTPGYYPLENRSGSVGIVKFIDSGHTMFITTLNKSGQRLSTVTGRQEEVKIPIDTLSGSINYTKPEIVDGIVRKCPVSFDLFGNFGNSEYIIGSKLTVICDYETVEGSDPRIVTYVGLDLNGQAPVVDGVGHVGTNLHDYSLGSVDYCTGYLPKSTSIVPRAWEFNIIDWIRTKKCNVAVPVYDLINQDYVTTSEGSDVSLAGKDAATINGVPFCGAYQVTIDGVDARHITVPAKHSGPSRNQAGEHSWEVLGSYPVSGYSAEIKGSGETYTTINPLSQGNLTDTDLEGLVSLSAFDTSLSDIDEFIESLGYYVGGKKNEPKSTASVITVGILKKFWALLSARLTNDLEERLDRIENNIKVLEENCNAIKDSTGADVDLGETEDKPEVEPVVDKNLVTLRLSKGQATLGSPVGASVVEVAPTGKIFMSMTDGSTREGEYTKTIKYDWDYPEIELDIKYGDLQLSRGNYLNNDSPVDGSTKLTVAIKNPESAPSFSNRVITFTTKTLIDNSEVTAQSTFILSFTNGNSISEGALISRTASYCGVRSDGTSCGAEFYPLGSTVKFHVSYDEFLKLQDTEVGRCFYVYFSQVKRINNGYVKLDSYPIGTSNGQVTRTSNPTDTDSTNHYNLKLHYDLWDPGTSGYTTKVALTYGDGKLFCNVEITVDPKPVGLDIDKKNLYFSASDVGSYPVTLTSNYPISYSNPTDWIIVSKLSDGNYSISVRSWTETGNNRSGDITFTNTGGESVVCTVTQSPATEYLVVEPITGKSYDKERILVGNSKNYVSEVRDSEWFEFYVYSNIEFSYYHDDMFRKSYQGSGGVVRVGETILSNNTANDVVHRIVIKSSLGSVYLNVTKAGMSDVMNVILPADLVFHKEDAFDIARTEKIIEVTCDRPTDLSIETDSDLLVAKVYHRGYKKALIHCYPRTVAVWKNDFRQNLKITYGDQTETVQFTFEETESTVGRYFNVSSTLLSFQQSSVSDQVLPLTAFSMSGELSLESLGSVATVSSKRIVGTGSYKYSHWDITIPAGKAPVSGTPWMLRLSNKTSYGTEYLYVSIYENSDVKISESVGSIQATAFGHVSMMDGCSVMPILYKKYELLSYIGYNKSPIDNLYGTKMYVYMIDHDLSKMSISDHQFWRIESGSYNLRYSTGANCAPIDMRINNMIKVEYAGKTCNFSNSLDTDLYYGPEYSQVHSSEKIVGHDCNDLYYPLLPSHECTVSPVLIHLGEPSQYKSTGGSINFYVTPPDWYIECSLTGSKSQWGYLNLPGSGGESQTFSYSVNAATTKFGATLSGILRFNLVRSTKVVLGNDGSREILLFDLQNELKYNYFRTSGVNLTSNQDGMGYFNSNPGTSVSYSLTNDNLAAVPGSSGFRIESKWIHQMGPLGNGWFNSSTKYNLYSKTLWGNALLYDTESSSVLSEKSPEELSMAITDGYHWSNPMKVFTGNTGISATIRSSMAQVAKANNNTEADVIYTPVVRVVSTKDGSSIVKDFLIVKKGVKFGIGATSAQNDGTWTPGFDLVVTEDHKDILTGSWYSGSYKYFSKGDIQWNKNIAPVTKNFITGDQLETAQSLDFDITPTDLDKILRYFFKTYYNINENLREPAELQWYFTADSSVYINETQKFLIPSVSWFKDLKISVILE